MGIFNNPNRKPSIIAFILLFSSFLSATTFASSILIWPLNPIIEEPNNATSLWVQNNGKESIFLQVRVLKWQQANNQDLLTEQKEILASPPVAEISAGKKQLIRLIKSNTVAANSENSYRVLIDEIPRDDNKTDNANSYGVTFQMRYSIPLFVQGDNVWTNQNYQKKRDINTATQPILAYKLQTKAGKRFLVIKNTGKVHARLTNVFFKQGNNVSTIAQGLMGYVLPNQEMSFLIPSDVKVGGILQATVNETPSPIEIKPY